VGVVAVFAVRNAERAGRDAVGLAAVARVEANELDARVGDGAVAVKYEVAVRQRDEAALADEGIARLHSRPARPAFRVEAGDAPGGREQPIAVDEGAGGDQALVEGEAPSARAADHDGLFVVADEDGVAERRDVVGVQVPSGFGPPGFDPVGESPCDEPVGLAPSLDYAGVGSEHVGPVEGEVVGGALRVPKFGAGLRVERGDAAARGDDDSVAGQEAVRRP
jgi:hypothetical protein